MKAVVFDMDGVIFDTEKLCYDSWCAVAKEHDIPDMDIVFPKCIGTNSRDTRQIVMDHYGPDFEYDVFSKEADGRFWEYIETKGIPVKKGVKELLEFLKKSGYQIALASSTKRASVEFHLSGVGILEYFQSLTTGDMVTHSKPDPEIYRLACESLGVEPAEAYAIEDSYNGIRSAYAAGMKPIMVPDLIPPNEEMEEKAHVILKDLLEVITYLGEQ